MQIPINILLTIPVLVVEAGKNTRRCIACHQLSAAIDDGLKRTKHQEDMVVDAGRLDSSGRHGKGSKKVPYGTSEARLVEILSDACKRNDQKSECYELVEDEVYYTPIKKWFTGGRKTPFLQTICYALISGCTSAATEKEAPKSFPASQKGLGDKILGMLPEKVRQHALVQKLIPYVKVAERQALKIADLGNKYGAVVLRNARIVGKRTLRNANIALDKLPIHEYIQKMPLSPKQASFVEQNWKIIVLTLFLALLIPLYCLSCKGVCRKANNRRAPPAAVPSRTRTAHKKAD
jgi:hypothetical protein